MPNRSVCKNFVLFRNATLLYLEYGKKAFQRRKKGEVLAGFTDVFSTDALGRIYTVHPHQDECFYLRLLLVNIRGPTSFESLRTVDGVLCATFREACQRLNLLENDAHWDLTLADATVSAPANQIRTLFAIIIATCHPSNPTELWNKYKDWMADDILHTARTTTSNFDLAINEEMLNEALVPIESIEPMPVPNRSMNEEFNRKLQRGQDYDQDEMTERLHC